jgi:hypothetical protein
MNEELNQITEAARALYTNLKADIQNAGTRVEHIRLTALTQEAANLLTELENMGSASNEESSAA